jgi:hypothetical protein
MTICLQRLRQESQHLAATAPARSPQSPPSPHPQRVHGEVPLAALDLLRRLIAACLAALLRRDRLAVDAARRGRTPPALLLPDLLAPGVVDLLQGVVVAPPVEVSPDGALGQEPSMAAGAGQGKDRVEDVPQ